MFVKPIIYDGIIGATFTNLVGDHWILLPKKYAIGLETFSLSFDNPPNLPLQIYRNIGKNSTLNEDTIPSTA